MIAMRDPLLEKFKPLSSPQKAIMGTYIYCHHCQATSTHTILGWDQERKLAYRCGRSCGEVVRVEHVV